MNIFLTISIIFFLLAAVVCGAFAICYFYAKHHMTAPKVYSGQIGMGHHKFSKKMKYVFIYKQNGKENSVVISDRLGKQYAMRPNVKAVIRQGQIGKQLVPIYNVNILPKG